MRGGTVSDTPARSSASAATGHVLRGPDGVTGKTRLLGSEVFLVGLSPKSAKTITELDIDLEGLVTRAKLRDGLAQALRRQGLKIVRA